MKLIFITFALMKIEDAVLLLQILYLEMHILCIHCTDTYRIQMYPKIQKSYYYSSRWQATGLGMNLYEM